jgi:spore coat polysaccharide biosynthesis protein SpsF
LQPILNADKPNGVTALEFIHNCCSHVKAIQEVVIACPDRDYETFSRYAKEQLEITGKRFYVFAGSEDNVYQRTLGAAQYRGADVVVDITSDCPLVSAYELAFMLASFLATASTPDRHFYMSNVFPLRMVPDGMDIQIYTTEFMAALEAGIIEPGHSGWNIFQRATQEEILEHPDCPFNEEHFKASKLRITLDTPEDLMVLRKLAPVFAELRPCTKKGLESFLAYMLSRPPEFWDNRDIRAKVAGEG